MKTRDELIFKLKYTRNEIKRLFLDTEYWNNLHPDQKPIDPDPDGFLKHMLEVLDKVLVGESVKEVKMINHKLLCLFEGKCFHEWERIDKPPNNYVRERKYMCSKCTVVDDYPFEIVDSPGYSSPNIYMPFLQWFWKEKREMWNAFLSVHPFAWDGKAIPYLFSLIDEGEPRIMVLLSEWLALQETRYAWGESKCNSCNGVGTWPDSGFERRPCPVCNGTGRIKAEWAKEA